MAERTDDLRAVCTQLEAFGFARCAMAHERVRRFPGTLRPRTSPLADHGWLRSPICASAKRLPHLGCAHTTARNRLRTLVEGLPPSVASREEIEGWRAEIVRLDLAVIDVDRRKSDAELDHARASLALVDERGTAADVAAVEDVLNDLVAEFDDCQAQLQALRDRILARVRRALEARSA